MSASCVIVTDGDARAALAAVRSLGAAGHTVHVIATAPRSLAGVSCFSTMEHVLPDAAREPQEWARALEAVAEKIGADVILPVTEVSHGVIYSLKIEDRWNVACPPRESYETAVDKHELMLRAADLGMDVPRSLLVSNPANLEELPESFRYPAVLKARRSRFFLDDQWQSGDVHIIKNNEELRSVAAEPGFRGGALLQEFIPGHGEAIFILAREGQTLAAFSHRRIREKPPTGGVSVLRESIKPDPNLLRASEMLLKSLGWTGVAMVEFRREPEGKGVLMEINPAPMGLTTIGDRFRRRLCATISRASSGRTRHSSSSTHRRSMPLGTR